MRFLLILLALLGFIAFVPQTFAEEDPLAALVQEAGGKQAVEAAAAAVAVADEKAASTTTPTITVTPQQAGLYSIQNPPPKPKALKDVESSGAQLRYLGELAGLQGWVGIRQGQPEYYYVTNDGKAVLMGILFDGATGGLITGMQLQAMKDANPAAFKELMGLTTQTGEAPVAAAASTSATPVVPTVPATPEAQKAAEVASAVAPPTSPEAKKESPSDVLLTMLDSAAGFTIGDAAAPKLYAFIDPECPHCKRFLSTVLDKKYIDDKKMSLRIIPVGRNAQSTQKAAYLLAVPNAADVLLKSVTDQSVYDKMPKDLSTGSVERNMQLLLKLKFNMTPSFVYRNTQGVVQIVRGLPDDIGPMLVDLGTIAR